MDQNTADQSWQRLQDHLQGFLGQFLNDDTKRIEYKPQFIVPLLEMSTESGKTERQGLA